MFLSENCNISFLPGDEVVFKNPNNIFQCEETNIYDYIKTYGRVLLVDNIKLVKSLENEREIDKRTEPSKQISSYLPSNYENIKFNEKSSFIPNMPLYQNLEPIIPKDQKPFIPIQKIASMDKSINNIQSPYTKFTKFEPKTQGESYINKNTNREEIPKPYDYAVHETNLDKQQKSNYASSLSNFSYPESLVNKQNNYNQKIQTNITPITNQSIDSYDVYLKHKYGEINEPIKNSNQPHNYNDNLYSMTNMNYNNFNQEGKITSKPLNHEDLNSIYKSQNTKIMTEPRPEKINNYENQYSKEAYNKEIIDVKEYNSSKDIKYQNLQKNDKYLNKEINYPTPQYYEQSKGQTYQKSYTFQK